MEYKVIPFVASINNRGTSQQVAKQLEDLILKQGNLGWNYVRLESVTTNIQGENGCFGIGATPGSTTFVQMAVFSK